MAVPDKVVVALDRAWSAEDFKNLVMIIPFATGMMNENPTEEEKKVYDDCALVCEKFLKKYKEI